MEIMVRTSDQIGQALRRFRKAKKLNQTETGKRSGLRQATISTLESGDASARLDTLTAVLAALDLELVVRERTKEPTDWVEFFKAGRVE